MKQKYSFRNYMTDLEIKNLEESREAFLAGYNYAIENRATRWLLPEELPETPTEMIVQYYGNGFVVNNVTGEKTLIPSIDTALGDKRKIYFSCSPDVVLDVKDLIKWCYMPSLSLCGYIDDFKNIPIY